jgi:hypothetical protein
MVRVFDAFPEVILPFNERLAASPNEADRSDASGGVEVAWTVDPERTQQLWFRLCHDPSEYVRQVANECVSLAVAMGKLPVEVASLVMADPSDSCFLD